MLKEAIEKIVEMAQPNIVSLNGKEYSDKPLRYIASERLAPMMETHTLSSIVDYIANGTDDDAEGINNRYVIHIEDFNRVGLKHELNSDKEREVLMLARDETATFPFGRYMSVENFIVAMQAFFLQDDTTSELVKLVSHVTDTNSVTQSDDGTTQTVTAKTGILTASQVAIPNPVQLAPLCTFSDAEQPMRRFVFRLKGGEDGVSGCLRLTETRGRMPPFGTSKRILSVRFRRNCAMTLLFSHNKDYLAGGEIPRQKGAGGAE